MRGTLIITLRLFDESVTFKTKAYMGSEQSPERIKATADDLRSELGTFPWEKILEKIDAKKAWKDIMEKFYG